MQRLRIVQWSYVPSAQRVARSFVPAGGRTPSAMRVAGQAGYTRQPAPLSERAIDLGATFGADWFDRIHVSTFDFALGNLIGEQERSLTVWNAHRRARILEALDKVNAEGVTVYGQSAPPLQFAPLQVRAFLIRVSPDGPPTIDAQLVFDFDGGQAFTIRFTGSRITVWSWPPDWNEDDVTERLAWRTQVMRSKYNGQSQKRRGRLSPLRTFEFTSTVLGGHRRALDAALHAWSSRSWALPIFTDLRMLSAPQSAGVSLVQVDTLGLDFRDGGLAMLWRSPSEFEVVEVRRRWDDRLELSRPTAQAWARGTRVYPVRSARLPAWPAQKLWADDGARIRPVFEITEPCDWAEAWPVARYRGAPVLEWRPNGDEDDEIAYERDAVVLAGGPGAVVVFDLPGTSFRADTFRWKLAGRAAHTRMRDLLYAFAGILGEAWVPTWRADLVLAATVAASDVGLLVAWCGYTRYTRGAVNRRDTRIELLDGTVFYRRITGWEEIDGATERLTIDQSLGRLVKPTDIRVISFMAYAEGGSDEVELRHETDADGLAEIGLRFRGVTNDV